MLVRVELSSLLITHTLRSLAGMEAIVCMSIATCNESRLADAFLAQVAIRSEKEKDRQLASPLVYAVPRPSRPVLHHQLATQADTHTRFS